MTIDASGRTKEAKEKGCSVYLAIHSNSGDGKATGTVAFYHPNSEQGKVLTENLVKELNDICPEKSNRWESVVNGMEAFNGAGYGEVKTPTQNGLLGLLSETNFHDNPMTAEWIISNKDTISRAYVTALVNSFKIEKKPISEPQGKLFRVQVGAFSLRGNAEEALAKAVKVGFKNAFIRYE